MKYSPGQFVIALRINPQQQHNTVTGSTSPCRLALVLAGTARGTPLWHRHHPALPYFAFDDEPVVCIYVWSMYACMRCVPERWVMTLFRSSPVTSSKFSKRNILYKNYLALLARYTDAFSSHILPTELDPPITGMGGVEWNFIDESKQRRQGCSHG